MRLLITFAILVLSVCELHAQATPPCTAPCTKSQLLNDVQTQFPDNTVGAITPSILRNFQSNLINSSMATAPTGSGAFTCYVGTTGLLGACTSALGLALGGTGATTQPAAAAAIFPPPVRAGDITYWNGSAWGTIPGNNTATGLLQQTNAGVPTWVSGSIVTPLVLPTPTRSGDVVYYNGTSWLTLPGNNSGTQVLSENASGTPSWVPSAVFPSTTRAGDVMYWNGTAWVTLAGNFTGTQVLTENSSGVPSWTTPGTVTSVTAGTGLSGGAITTTGTIALNMGFLSSSLGADVSLTPINTYLDGPSVSQGTSGTWFASGTVTLSDTAANVAFICKLWDGTTIMSSGATVQGTVTASITMGLSGFIASPAGNIRITCKNTTDATGKILFNLSGNSKDSTVNALRIQ
jgi:hypothetical protein